jgi:hypothetical protein
VDRPPGYVGPVGRGIRPELTCSHLTVVEHYRNLWNFVRVIYEKEDNGTSICNATSCPRMSAGA